MAAMIAPFYAARVLLSAAWASLTAMWLLLNLIGELVLLALLYPIGLAQSKIDDMLCPYRLRRARKALNARRQDKV